MPVQEKTRNTGGFHSASTYASSPTFLNTFDRESKYPVFSSFCHFLSIADIISLTRTCKKLSGLYQSLLPVSWDVDKALRPYFKDPTGFRSQMARHNVLILGDFATWYFERAPHKCQSFDLVVQEGAGFEAFKDYLSSSAGYVEVGHETYDPDTCIIESRTMKHADSKLKVTLLITRVQPTEALVWETSTTAAFNILSWNKAYSVFALSTFIHSKSYLLGEMEQWTESQVKHDSLNGWTVQGVMWPEETRCNHPIRQRRRIGDCYTWTIAFDTNHVEWSETPDSLLEDACFKTDVSAGYDDERPYDPAQEDVRQYSIEVNTLKSKVLKHTYYLSDSLMMDFFARRLHAATIFELRKLAPRDRPANFDAIMRDRASVDTALRDFDPPTSWAYRDKEIPTWLKAFEQYCPE